MNRNLLAGALTFLLVCLSISGAAQTEEQPAWVRAFIAKKEAEPVTNPPGSLTQCTYKGKVVYFYPGVCCDQFSELYDKEGNGLCAPDGGMTGDGDGKCADFHNTKTDCEVIWNDTRNEHLSISGVKAFQKRCEKTGGIFMDCAAAFAQLCADATAIDGRQVVCSCPEGTSWDAQEGCH